MEHRKNGVGTDAYIGESFMSYSVIACAYAYWRGKHLNLAQAVEAMK